MIPTRTDQFDASLDDCSFERLTVRVPRALADRLRRTAKEAGESVNTLARQALRDRVQRTSLLEHR